MKNLETKDDEEKSYNWLESNDVDFEKKIEYNKKDDFNMDEFMFVDEIDKMDLEKFNDTNYWRRKSADEESLKQALKDLDL